MIPMHGVQPTAKIAPSPKLASQPPRLETSRPPRRSPNVGPPPAVAAPADANDIVPVVLATEPAAPASSGRHDWARRGIVINPARFSPRTTGPAPPMTRSAGRYWERPAAANVAVTPSNVKTAAKPRT